MKQEKGNTLIFVILLLIAAFVLASGSSIFFGSGKKGTNSGSSSSLHYVSPQKPSSSSQNESNGQTTLPEKESDNSPPKLSDPQPHGDLPFETRETYISVKTNEKATCRYSDVSGVYYEYMQNNFSTEDGLFHQALITTLSEGGSYIYYVRCRDESGNENTQDLKISFDVEVPKDVTPPQRSNVYPKGEVFPADTTKVMLGITTDEPAYCRYDATGTDYNSMHHNFSNDTYKRYHTAIINNLANGQSYGFYVRCKDLAGNKNTNDVLISFSVAQ